MKFIDRRIAADSMTRWEEREYEIPCPPEFQQGAMRWHDLQAYWDRDGNRRLIALGRTCCTRRKRGCAYLGTCRLTAPPDIDLGLLRNSVSTGEEEK